MKTVALICLALACSLSLMANYVVKQPYEHIQPDGSKLSLFITGDEFSRRVHDEQGYTIVQHPETGYAVYAVPEGNGFKASSYVVGSIDPAALNIPVELTQDPALTMALVARHRDAIGTANDRAPSTGTINNIFIFCRFADQSEFTQAISTYDNMCNSTTSASMRGYFQ